MNTRKLSLNITTIIGVVLAVATFLLALTFLGSKDETTTVYVATQDIGATKLVNNNMIAARSVSIDSVPADAITNFEDIIGRYAIDDIFQGEVITSRRIANETLTSAEILTEDLGPDTRLISIQADVSAALAGRIKTGDIVDVIAVLATEGTGAFAEGADQELVDLGSTFAQTIIQQARVVDVNLPADALAAEADRTLNEDLSDPANPAESGPNPVIPGIYTLAVTSAQAQLLALSEESGKLYLVLTPPNAAEVTGPPTGLNEATRPGALAPLVTPATGTTTPTGGN